MSFPGIETNEARTHDSLPHFRVFDVKTEEFGPLQGLPLQLMPVVDQVVDARGNILVNV